MDAVGPNKAKRSIGKLNQQLISNMEHSPNCSVKHDTHVDVVPRFDYLVYLRSLHAWSDRYSVVEKIDITCTCMALPIVFHVQFLSHCADIVSVVPFSLRNMPFYQLLE
jgi:hypothetical protein